MKLQYMHPPLGSGCQLSPSPWAPIRAQTARELLPKHLSQTCRVNTAKWLMQLEEHLKDMLPTGRSQLSLFHLVNVSSRSLFWEFRSIPLRGGRRPLYQPGMQTPFQALQI